MSTPAGESKAKKDALTQELERAAVLLENIDKFDPDALGTPQLTADQKVSLEKMMLTEIQIVDALHKIRTEKKKLKEQYITMKAGLESLKKPGNMLEQSSIELMKKKQKGQLYLYKYLTDLETKLVVQQEKLQKLISDIVSIEDISLHTAVDKDVPGKPSPGVSTHTPPTVGPTAPAGSDVSASTSRIGQFIGWLSTRIWHSASEPSNKPDEPRKDGSPKPK